jgi:ATP-binding cassette subfamily F protein 3
VTLLQVSDIRFGFAGTTLFQGVTFTLAAGERAALVAPNGAGKSTLLRIIGKEIEPDAGTAVISKEAKLGYYRQSHEVAASGDVMSALLSGFAEVTALRAELTKARDDAAHATSENDPALTKLAQLEDRYHMLRGDALEHKVAAIVTKLGFQEKDLARPVSSLSGGERGRLQLGVVLAQEPSLLMLDEPTNHLDLDTIAWLEQYLSGFRGALLIVSHDRAFLDNVCTETMELGRQQLRVYPLRYSEYAVAREEDLARERALLERQQAFVDKTEDFIRKNMAGQKSKQAQSRRKMLDKLDRQENPEDVWQAAGRVRFRFAEAPRTGDIVIDAKGLSASRGGTHLFGPLDLLVRRGDRIGIVGPNGAGKSTLLKLLAGRGLPEDQGDIKRGTNLAEGYFDQHLGGVDPKNTATEEVRTIRGDFTAEVARQYLARFRFYGDDPLRSVGGFSGGERSRLALAKLLLEPKNLLFLDEPTNHLDIPAAEILEEALSGFPGTVFLVSHDRRFLEATTTRLIVVRDGHADVYPGGFKDYAQNQAKERELAREEKEAARAEAASQKKKSLAPPPPKVEAQGKQGFEQQKAQAREKEKKRKRIAELEDLIAAGEKELEERRAVLREDPGGDWAKLAKNATEEQQLAKRVDTMIAEWTRLSEEP